MTALNGWVHDRFGTAWMLAAEALSALICIVLALLVFARDKTRCRPRRLSATVSSLNLKNLASLFFIADDRRFP